MTQRPSRSRVPHRGVRLPVEQRMALARAERAVDEATSSRQPRFGATVKPETIFNSVSKWLTYADLTEPSYSPDSRTRDEWLRGFWKKEPHLAGVLNSVITLDKNRGWSVTGGRNQVYRVTDMLHAAHAAPGLIGWRNYFSAQALSYYTTDMNLLAETGREGRFGPLRGLFHLDSARCKLTGREDIPLEYYPSTPIKGQRGQGKIDFPSDGYFRVTSMPSDNELYFGLGYCAVSRMLELSKMMVAVFRKDQELLGARMPEGLLLLQGIQQGQWDDAMADRESKLTAKERQYFGGVFVLATAGVDEIDAKLIALRQLPENFTLETFTDMYMYALALTFGYSAREFWPASGGALGTATESEVQDDNSTGKGESDLILNYQEQLAEELPETVLYEFDERDSKGDAEMVEILQAKTNWVKSMSELKGGSGTTVPGGADPETGQDLPPQTVPAGNLLNADQIWQLGVDQGIIPEEWVRAEDADVTSTDIENDQLERWRAVARSSPALMQAMRRFPRETIVRYSYRRGRRSETVLWEDLGDMTRARAWAGNGPGKIEQAMSAVKKLTRAVEALGRVRTQPQIVPAVASGGPVFNLISGQDGPSVLRMAEPPQAAPIVIDTRPIAVAMTEALSHIPRGLTLEDLTVAMRDILRALPQMPTAEALGAEMRSVLGSAPRGPSAKEIAQALTRAIPPGPEPFDYDKFAAALASALADAPAPQVIVEMPEPRPATFNFEYDAQGRIKEATREPGR